MKLDKEELIIVKMALVWEKRNEERLAGPETNHKDQASRDLSIKDLNDVNALITRVDRSSKRIKNEEEKEGER